jgi:hypothetical protein
MIVCETLSLPYHGPGSFDDSEYRNQRIETTIATQENGNGWQTMSSDLCWGMTCSWWCVFKGGKEEANARGITRPFPE